VCGLCLLEGEKIGDDMYSMYQIVGIKNELQNYCMAAIGSFFVMPFPKKHA
jgi:hypothetical protein